jgi:molybdopterin-guanine dinucleotide biosynthesis protein MobB
MVERQPDDEEDRDLHDLMNHLDHSKLDLILVEGFKPVKMPKIELNRPSLRKPSLHENDDSVIAIATDEPDKFSVALPILDLGDANAIADFIIGYFFDNTKLTNRISNG